MRARLGQNPRLIPKALNQGKRACKKKKRGVYKAQTQIRKEDHHFHPKSPFVQIINLKEKKNRLDQGNTTLIPLFCRSLHHIQAILIVDKVPTSTSSKMKMD